MKLNLQNGLIWMQNLNGVQISVQNRGQIIPPPPLHLTWWGKMRKPKAIGNDSINFAALADDLNTAIYELYSAASKARNIHNTLTPIIRSLLSLCFEPHLRHRRPYIFPFHIGKKKRLMSKRKGTEWLPIVRGIKNRLASKICIEKRRPRRGCEVTTSSALSDSQVGFFWAAQSVLLTSRVFEGNKKFSESS